MKTSDIQQIIKIGKDFQGYDETPKGIFHQKSKKYLKEIASLLKLKPTEYQIRSNKAGIACLGEVTLHSDKIYVQLGTNHLGSFLYRSCKGQKDYSGGHNQWMPYENLLDIDSVVQTLSKLQS